jgi:mono/diheme cytochrome c family protein
MAVPVIIVLLVGGLALYLMFSGPHMRDEPKFTPYRALLPATPEGTVPVAFAETQNVPSLRNPLPDTERTRRTGQVYYGYYCVFCHGENGRGDGPVGRSYVPTPADLTAASVRNLSDGALYKAMRTGVGHAPVLDYVMEPNAPWYIVDYVRHLSTQEQDNLTSVPR